MNGKSLDEKAVLLAISNLETTYLQSLQKLRELREYCQQSWQSGEQEKGQGTIKSTKKMDLSDWGLTEEGEKYGPTKSEIPIQQFSTGAKRSERMPRYDLIPRTAIDRLAQRFTGEIRDGKPTGGALKYGESNWQKGLPTSDVLNHAINHLLAYQDAFHNALIQCIEESKQADTDYNVMENVRILLMNKFHGDDELAGAMWGICVLMYQEKHGMFRDETFAIR